jgi:hypothetical protein
MHSALERARRYRDRAEELRTLKELWPEPMACEALERLARDFDSLADKLDPSRIAAKEPVAAHDSGLPH